MTDRLTPDELAAAEVEAAARQQERTQVLQRRGWNRTQPFDRHDLQEWTLDRWVLRNNTRRVQ